MDIDTPSRCSPVRVSLEDLKRDASLAQTLGQGKASESSTNNQNVWFCLGHILLGERKFK